jgi:hypothetical protein
MALAQKGGTRTTEFFLVIFCQVIGLALLWREAYWPGVVMMTGAAAAYSLSRSQVKAAASRPVSTQAPRIPRAPEKGV